MQNCTNPPKLDIISPESATYFISASTSGYCYVNFKENNSILFFCHSVIKFDIKTTKTGLFKGPTLTFFGTQLKFRI